MSMPVSDVNYQGFALPAVIDPPDHLCFTVKVPNDQGHIAAFLGALFELTQWLSWQRDSAKRGKDAAAVWRAIWTDLAAQSCNPSTIHGAEIEDFMPLRVDCNCNVFVTCCDGTEKQILTAAQVQALINSQPGAGAPQPPAGGCQTYNAAIPGPNQFLVPVPVSTGDTLTVHNATGAVHDGQDTRWFCPDGGVYFAGANTEIFVSAEPFDPLATARHGQLIIDIAGTFYSILPNTPFTVPAGVSNIQPTILANIQATTASGNFNFDVEVCNNATPSWTSVFDLTTSPYSSIWSVLYGTWSAGVGFNGTSDGVAPFIVELSASPAAFTLLSASITYNAGAHGGAQDNVSFQVPLGTFYGPQPPLTTGTDQVFSHTETKAGVTNIVPNINSGSAGAQCTMTKIVIQGQGNKPIGWP